LNSFALEANSRLGTSANRFFASFNRFRDFRDPFSAPFPTIEIAQDGVTYTTVGHEPFSIDNTLDQDVWQFTDNFSYFAAKHVITVAPTSRNFSFFNSFNIFRYGVFFLPLRLAARRFRRLTTSSVTRIQIPLLYQKFQCGVAAVVHNPYKGEDINVGSSPFTLRMNSCGEGSDHHLRSTRRHPDVFQRCCG